MPGFRFSSALVVLLAATACERAEPPATIAPASKVAAVDLENGAISVAPVSERAAPVPKDPRTAWIDWKPTTLSSGQVWLSCSLDYTQGDGATLLGLDRETVEAALQDCAARGVVRVRFRGRIAADFVAMIERVTRVADKLEIRKRVLDLNSAGGQVEDAIRAGDFIAASRWTVWVREDSLCYSACVFLLSAGDVRRIAGKVGIHRIIRMSSTATTRAELNAELRLVHGRVRDYLERNGTSVAVADLMMAVPNRSLRQLTDDELLRFGLDGVNPAQDDLDRLRLQRECGDDFVARRDAFARAFDRRCRLLADELDQLNECGLALRRQFGFPDADCPAESPLSEFDLTQAEPEAVDEALGASPPAGGDGGDSGGAHATQAAPPSE
jgi:hypothetical protein